MTTAPIRRLVAFVALLLVVAPVQPTLLARAEPRVAAVEAVAMVGTTVSDMDRSVDFYTRVLSFRKIADEELAGPEVERLHGVFGARIRVVRLALGDEVLELTEFLAPRGRPMPVDSHGNDRWFQHVAIIVSDMDRAYHMLRDMKVGHASTGPQTLPDWNTNAAGIKAFYFRDPDGHFLEILQFPPGKGDARWHRSDGLFLGIDHTAIVVGDTDASLGFYRDTLGLRVAGGSENYGTEQEHLNNVFGARLRITTLRAAAGPGVELLEYLAPRDGRPAPVDLRANDVAHWQTTVVTDDASPLVRHSDRYTLVSPDVIDVPRAALGFARGLLLRDADGHGVRVVSGTASGS